MSDPIQQAADQVADLAAAESAAITAQTAAESTVIAAETAVALAAATAASAQLEAAETIRENEAATAFNEEQTAWLNERLTAHQALDQAWKTQMESSLLAINDQLAQLTQTVSPVLTPEALPEEPALLIPEIPPSAAVDVPPEVEMPIDAPRKKRFRVL